jgi:hypothetical protein
MKILITLLVLLFSLTSFAKTYTFHLADERFAGKPFIATITSASGIASFEHYLKKGQVQVLENGDPDMGIFNGSLRRRIPSPDHNWPFEFVSAKLEVADVAIEVCDASMQFLEDNLDEWLSDVGSWCPFSSRSLVQKIFRGKRLIYSRSETEF